MALMVGRPITFKSIARKWELATGESIDIKKLERIHKENHISMQDLRNYIIAAAEVYSSKKRKLTTEIFENVSLMISGGNAERLTDEKEAFCPTCSTTELLCGHGSEKGCSSEQENS